MQKEEKKSTEGKTQQKGLQQILTKKKNRRLFENSLIEQAFKN